jgi:pimeloyl-ACP methyl ester carboxylesterase
VTDDLSSTDTSPGHNGQPSAPDASARAKTEHLKTELPALGIRVHARAWRDHAEPDRVPVVLVHGLGLSSRYLVPLGRRLGALGYAVYAPDLLGFGRTRRPRGRRWPAAPDVAQQTEDLRAWLAAAGIERAVFFGNSVGVQVATELAVRHPQLVERLVLSGPTPDPAYRSPLKQYPRVLRNMAFEMPSLNPVFQLEYLSTGMVRMAGQLVRTVDDPIEDRLPRIGVPALVVRGRYDQTLSQAWAEQFTRLLPDGRLVVVEGAAHNVHYSAPHVMARLMDSFLRGRLDAHTSVPGDGVVVPALDGGDPLAPRRPVSPTVHAALDYVTAAGCLVLPRVLGWGPRTRRILGAAGASGLAYSLVTDYSGGSGRKMPLPLHLAIDSASGMELVMASATLLRGEPAAGRWAVAAQGGYEIARSVLTRKAAGPARLVPATATRQ